MEISKNVTTTTLTIPWPFVAPTEVEIYIGAFPELNQQKYFTKQVLLILPTYYLIIYRGSAIQFHGISTMQLNMNSTVPDQFAGEIKLEFRN